MRPNRRRAPIRRKQGALVAVLALVLAAVLAACGSSNDNNGSSGSSKLTPVKLQLQWVAQAQFAGYYAAVAQGFYKKEGLDVQIVEGGPDIVPIDALTAGDVDYAISWVPKVLGSIEAGAKVTDVAQIFERSATTQISFKDKGITSPADFKGKKIGSWGYGNEWELFAGMQKDGVTLKDISLVQQAFDMNGFLAGDIDAAQAMTYNEYAQVLESKNPDTGELYQPDDLNVINWNDVGTAMLQDAIWAPTDKLKDSAFADTTVKFIKASIEGWVVCTRPSAGRRPDRDLCGVQARPEPPALDDQRGQQADLALDRRRRDDQCRPVEADRRHRPGHQERPGQDDHHQDAAVDGVQQRVRPEGPGRAQERGRRRDGHGLPADRRHPQGGRGVGPGSTHLGILPAGWPQRRGHPAGRPGRNEES